MLDVESGSEADRSKSSAILAKSAPFKAVPMWLARIALSKLELNETTKNIEQPFLPVKH
jgi:hypothetical protein